MDKLQILRTRFPALDITIGYIGSTYGLPGTPAFRDARAFKVFTNIPQRLGGCLALSIDDTTTFDVDEVSLTLQNVIVHRAREANNELPTCPCRTCIAQRVRGSMSEQLVAVSLATANAARKAAEERHELANAMPRVRVAHSPGDHGER